jgi:hypothetical protein
MDKASKLASLHFQYPELNPNFESKRLARMTESEKKRELALREFEDRTTMSGLFEVPLQHISKFEDYFEPYSVETGLKIPTSVGKSTCVYLLYVHLDNLSAFAEATVELWQSITR